MTQDPVDKTPVNLSPSESIENKQLDFDRKKYSKIRGWLIFLIVTLMFLTPAGGSRLLSLTDENYKSYLKNNSFVPEKLLPTLKLYKASIRVCMGLSFISGLLLLLRLRIGVTITKLFLITNVTVALIMPVLMLLMDSQERINQLMFEEGLTDIPGRLIVCGAWYAYLLKSKRVASVYRLKK